MESEHFYSESGFNHMVQLLVRGIGILYLNLDDAGAGETNNACEIPAVQPKSEGHY